MLSEFGLASGAATLSDDGMGIQIAWTPFLGPFSRPQCQAGVRDKRHPLSPPPDEKLTKLTSQ